MEIKTRKPVPCTRDCKRRSWDCHTWCKDYKDFCLDRNGYLLERVVDNRVIGYTVDRVNKARKRKRKWRKASNDD